MKLLPKRNVSFSCAMPPMRGMCGDLVPSEQSVRLWLSAFPGLLGWREGLTWLAPGIADSRRKSPESLRGLDAIGSLILAETRIDRGDAPDPFEKFVQYVKSASMQRTWSADALRAMWLKCSRKNPYAQEAIKQLQLAYFATFVPLIGSDSYEQSIESSLEIRDAIGNPPPVFVGVVATAHTGFRLSPKALKNVELLQKHVGIDRVLLRVIRARLTPRGLLIECRSPESNDVTRVLTRKLL